VSARTSAPWQGLHFQVAVRRGADTFWNMQLQLEQSTDIYTPFRPAGEASSLQKLIAKRRSRTRQLPEPFSFVVVVGDSHGRALRTLSMT
jgi:hypothetical protein